jgi:hypothetical protein
MSVNLEVCYQVHVRVTVADWSLQRCDILNVNKH